MNSKITLTLPDGTKKEFHKGITGIEVAKTIGRKLAEDTLAVRLGEKTIEAETPINESGSFKVLTWSDNEGKKALWHTAAHVLNEAVQELFPKAIPTIGPPIENGFYYDFDTQTPFTKEDLEKIEKKMSEITAIKGKITAKELQPKEALKIFEKNPYKQELINEFSGEGKKITLYYTGKFFDLCKGGHTSDTGKIKAVKLLKTAGAYWRGSEKNKMLQRIYGIAFPKKEMLDEFLELQKKAEQNSHLKLGKELDLFSINEYAPGTIFFHQKGAALYNILVDFLRKEQNKRGYQEVITPLIMKKKLWEQSGHYDHYRENMYFVKIDEEDFAVKPMNCPGHIIVYQNARHSYRELPIKIAEFGTVHRHELSGVLNGMFRVRKFTQDDAHIFCGANQLKEAITDVIELTISVYKKFGFEVQVEISTRPQNSMGEEQAWEKATSALKEALEEKKVVYRISPGTGAFYGPKIDFHITDSLRRTWQLGTVQVDFFMPQKFELYFINQEDKKETPVIVHRAIFGSLERFIGILIEHFAGAFPAWVAPIQARIFTVSQKSEEYCKKIHKELIEKGIRCEIDLRQETVSHKVRDAQMQKIPFILTVGEKEQQNNTIAVRDRNGKISFDVKIDDFARALAES